MTSTDSRRKRPTLNTDGERHPKENALAFLALGLGIVSLLTAFDADLRFVGALTGLAGLVIGLYDQYISATTGERWVIVPAVGVSALGLALALANGALPST